MSEGEEEAMGAKAPMEGQFMGQARDLYCLRRVELGLNFYLLS